MKTIALFILTICSISAFAQEKTNNKKLDVKSGLKATDTSSVKKADGEVEYYEGDFDTLPTYTINEVQIYTRPFKDDVDLYHFNMLKKRIIKVYPYLEMARELLAEIEENEKNASKKKQFKKYKKSREKELREEFEAELKDLTRSQGQVLVKLVNRETGNSFYKLIKDLKGGFKAFFYQKIGKRYGYDLKEEYDPNADENSDIELIVKGLDATNPGMSFMTFE